jgi:rod shape-determining protein MreC
LIKKTLAALAVTILLFLGLSRILGISDGVLERLTSYIVYPFLRIQRSIGESVSSFKNTFKNSRESLALFESSERRVEELQKELVELKAFLNYTEHTHELVEFAKRYETEKSLIGRVLLRSLEDTQFFILDRGSTAGVENDMVAVYKDFIVGRIIEVYPYYSKVLLLTDPSCKISAFCASQDQRGIHEGIKKLQVTKLGHVDPLVKCKIGDVVLTSGDGGLFPRGFGLGEIIQWETDGGFVKPFVNVKTLEYCSIVKNPIMLRPLPE